jgi:hypothetical protein
VVAWNCEPIPRDYLNLYWVLTLSTPVVESPLTLTDYMADIPIQVSEYVSYCLYPVST